MRPVQTIVFVFLFFVRSFAVISTQTHPFLLYQAHFWFIANHSFDLPTSKRRIQFIVRIFSYSILKQNTSLQENATQMRDENLLAVLFDLYSTMNVEQRNQTYIQLQSWSNHCDTLDTVNRKIRHLENTHSQNKCWGFHDSMNTEKCIVLFSRLDISIIILWVHI